MQVIIRLCGSGTECGCGIDQAWEARQVGKCSGDKKNKGEKEIHVHQVDGEVGKPCWLLISGCLKVR